MKEFRCSKCGKLLAMLWGTAEIRCPRCKTDNKITLRPGVHDVEEYYKE